MFYKVFARCINVDHTNICRAIIWRRTKYDMISPPDPTSNLPSIKFKTENAKRQTRSEIEFQNARNKTQIWNQEFWRQHNIEFMQSKDEYITKECKRKGSKTDLSADEMSIFYKDFLDKNWHKHLNYNFTWYRKNITLLWLEAKVVFEKLFNSIKTSRPSL